MTRLVWDKVGERRYETGVNKGVLYIPNVSGVYNTGVAWNGLTTVTESPSGAEATPIYADNIKYLNLISAEEFGATLEAYMCPDEFYQFDGVAEPSDGVYVGQQSRKAFGLSYQTRIGNDTQGSDLGYKIHLIYGAQAAPSERAYSTINDSPEAMTLSWELTTSPVDAGENLKPTAQLVIDSTKVDPDALASLEAALYGSPGTDPRLPLPTEVLDMFSSTAIEVTTVAPDYDSGTDLITIPDVTGVIYSIDGNDVAAGDFGPITESKIVLARPAQGYKFSPTSDNDWSITYS
jgi:hypothetical protein